MFEGFVAEPGFDYSEAFCSYSFLHLAEVGLAGCLVTVATGFSEVGVSSEAFDEVLEVRYLFELAEHEGP